jgi:hypothetical protein
MGKIRRDIIDYYHHHSEEGRLAGMKSICWTFPPAGVY